VPSSVRKQSRRWRALGFGASVLAGALFATSAVNSGGSDLRDAGFENIADLVNRQAATLATLRAQAAELNDQVTSLTAALQTDSSSKLQSRVDALRASVGLTAVTGPGVTVTLWDAPRSVREQPGVDVSQLLVHQQDIEAVMNALWSAGAEAMSVQDQRVISTTGVKCVGNSVIVDGVPYAPPYVIQAIGDPSRLLAALDTSDYLALYRSTAALYQLGWKVEPSDALDLPGYAGSLTLNSARAAASP
jgi:uncharacterized protein YlxW (UPF0749 family)